MRLLPLMAVLAAACSSTRYFVPRENQNGTGPTGHPAAVYPLASAAGELRLWSRGAELVEVDGDRVVELHVGFELENTGDAPVALDAGGLVCDDVLVDDHRLSGAAPVRVAGGAEAAPGASTVVDAWFRPPAGRPRDIDGFTVRFRVVAGDRVVLAQATPFAPYFASERWYDDGWYGGAYFWGPPFGWGWHGRYCR